MGKGIININKEVFRFHQGSTSSLIVGAMVEGLKLGHEMPALYLHKCAAGFDGFGTDFYGVFEGNHRFKAHKRLGMNPEWEHPPIWAEVPHYKFTEREVALCDGFPAEEIERKLKDSLSYLPQGIAEEFCLRNKLDLERFLPQ